VDEAADVGPFSSLGFDANGLAHISYYDDITMIEIRPLDRLRLEDHHHPTAPARSACIPRSRLTAPVDRILATTIPSKTISSTPIGQAATGAFRLLTAPSKAPAMDGMGTSLVLDSQNRPRIAYFDGKNNDLKVAL